jgi:hypothetical protein
MPAMSLDTLPQGESDRRTLGLAKQYPNGEVEFQKWSGCWWPFRE